MCVRVHVHGSALSLNGNKLTSLPSVMMGLGALQSLDASSNLISTSLPTVFVGFAWLTSLVATQNYIYGSVPTSLVGLNSLQVLGVRAAVCAPGVSAHA